MKRQTDDLLTKIFAEQITRKDPANVGKLFSGKTSFTSFICLKWGVKFIIRNQL
jgi:hypothetical protein